MSFFGDILGAASKAVGGLIGGGSSSPISGLLDKAGDALGGLIGDVTGDKLGDKIGDKIGDIIGSDKLGDKIGDFLGNAIGGESKVADFLTSKSDVIGDKLGDLFGSDKAGDVIGNVLGGVGDGKVDPTAEATPTVAPETEHLSPEAQPGKPAIEEATETIDLSKINERLGEPEMPEMEGIDLSNEAAIELPGNAVDASEPVHTPSFEMSDLAMTNEQLAM